MLLYWKCFLIGLLLVAVCTATSLFAEPFLVAHWTMDESPGSEFANDSSLNDNTGWLMGANPATAWVPGRVGTALSLDGVGDYVDVPFDQSLQLGYSDFTIAAWANLNQAGKHQNIVSFGDVGTLGGGVAELVFLQNGNLIGAYAAHDPVIDQSITVIPPAEGIYGRWVHVAMVRDMSAKTFTVYLDGQVGGSMPGAGGDMDFQNTAWGVSLGKGFYEEPNVNARPSQGLIDDIRIYADALTQAEILALPGGVGGGTVEPTTSFIWSQTGYGDWNEKGNWSPLISDGPPNTENQVAKFGGAINGPSTVITDLPVTVNRLEFDNNANGYAIAGQGEITLAPATVPMPADPSIEVKGDHQIQASVRLLGDTTVNVAAGSSLEFNNRLNLGSNTLTTTGGGLLSINNIQNADGGGGVAVGSGVLNGSGKIGGDLANENGGTVAPGNSPGTLTVDGNYTQGATGTLAIEIAETAFDRLVVNGQANLAGTLDVTLLDGYVPSDGATFDILDFSSVSGDFDTLNLPTDFSWDVTTGLLSVGAGGPGLPGDFNGNGVVDAADYTLWQDGLGTTYTQADYVVWRDNFGSSAGGGASAAVPEPTCWMMMVITLATMAGLSRRSARR